MFNTFMCPDSIQPVQFLSPSSIEVVPVNSELCVDYTGAEITEAQLHIKLHCPGLRKSIQNKDTSNKPQVKNWTARLKACLRSNEKQAYPKWSGKLESNKKSPSMVQLAGDVSKETGSLYGKITPKESMELTHWIRAPECQQPSNGQMWLKITSTRICFMILVCSTEILGHGNSVKNLHEAGSLSSLSTISAYSELFPSVYFYWDSGKLRHDFVHFLLAPFNEASKASWSEEDLQCLEKSAKRLEDPDYLNLYTVSKTSDSEDDQLLANGDKCKVKSLHPVTPSINIEYCGQEAENEEEDINISNIDNNGLNEKHENITVNGEQIKYLDDEQLVTLENIYEKPTANSAFLTKKKSPASEYDQKSAKTTLAEIHIANTEHFQTMSNPPKHSVSEPKLASTITPKPIWSESSEVERAGSLTPQSRDRTKSNFITLQRYGRSYCMYQPGVRPRNSGRWRKGDNRKLPISYQKPRFAVAVCKHNFAKRPPPPRGLVYDDGRDLNSNSDIRTKFKKHHGGENNQMQQFYKSKIPLFTRRLSPFEERIRTPKVCCMHTSLGSQIPVRHKLHKSRTPEKVVKRERSCSFSRFKKDQCIGCENMEKCKCQKEAEEIRNETTDPEIAQCKPEKKSRKKRIKYPVSYHNLAQQRIQSRQRTITLDEFPEEIEALELIKTKLENMTDGQWNKVLEILNGQEETNSVTEQAKTESDTALSKELSLPPDTDEKVESLQKLSPVTSLPIERLSKDMKVEKLHQRHKFRQKPKRNGNMKPLVNKGESLIPYIYKSKHDKEKELHAYRF